jgi:hypothetical protein
MEVWQAVKDRGGRPRRFKSPQEMLEECYNYFNWAKQNATSTPEQRKGSISIPKDFDGDLNSLNPLIDIPDYVFLTIEELCIYIGVNSKWLDHFERVMIEKENNPEISEEKKEEARNFCNVITHVREIIRSNQLKGAGLGKLQPAIIASLCRLKKDVDVTSNDKTVTGITVNIIDPETAKDLDEE